jgi:outer membrane murein-binding lipoprotein Lpp
MKKLKTFTLVLLLIISLTILAGCAESPEVNNSAYDDLLEQYNNLSNENDKITNERDSIKNDNEALEDKNAELISEIESLSNNVSSLSSQLGEKTVEVNEQNERLNELQPYIELSLEEVELRRESLGKQQVLDGLDAEIEAKQAELDSLIIRIRETGEAPITLGAGEYKSPEDVPPGRYTVTENSNFFVYSARDRLQVNTILGGRRGEDSYTFWLESGGRIEARGRFTLTPVE